jgi:hypothetical protein
MTGPFLLPLQCKCRVPVFTSRLHTTHHLLSPKLRKLLVSCVSTSPPAEVISTASPRATIKVGGCTPKSLVNYAVNNILKLVKQSQIAQFTRPCVMVSGTVRTAGYLSVPSDGWKIADSELRSGAQITTVRRRRAGGLALAKSTRKLYACGRWLDLNREGLHGGASPDEGLVYQSWVTASNVDRLVRQSQAHSGDRPGWGSCPYICQYPRTRRLAEDTGVPETWAASFGELSRHLSLVRRE